MKKRIQHIISQIRQFEFFESFKHTSTLFMATVITQALGIISIRVYTYFMDDAQYGIISVYLSYATALSIVLTFNLNGAISRYYYEEREDYREFNGTSIMSAYLVLTVLSALLLVFRESVAELINLPVIVIPWMVAFVYTIVLWRVYETFFIARKQSKLFAFTFIALQYSKFGAAVVGLYLVSSEIVYMGKLVGELVPAGLISGFLLYKLWPHIKWRFSWNYIRYILHYCLPLIPLALSGYILQYFDQWFINSSLGNGPAGLYSFAYKIGLLLFGFITALVNGTNPQFYQMMNRESYKEVDSQVSSMMKLLVLATFFLILFAPDLGALLTAKESFKVALPLVPVLVMGYFFYGIHQFFSRLINYSKRNLYLTFVVLLAGIVNIILNAWYIPRLGYEAAAYTTLASFVVMALGSWITTRFILKLHQPPAIPILSLTLLLLIFMLADFGLNQLHFNWMILAILELILFGIFALIVFRDKVKSFLTE